MGIKYFFHRFCHVLVTVFNKRKKKYCLPYSKPLARIRKEGA